MEEKTQPKVLYIEDDAEMIDLVRLILSRHGYTVTGANGGRQGLEKIAENPPDIILLDLMMPEMDGWDVYHQLKGADATRSIPVIVVTAKSQAVDRVLGLHIAHVDDYISKPFRPQELLDSIQKVLSARSQPTDEASA